MSDKQIVERNGVSMDRHSSGIDWSNDEAVVKSAIPTAYEITGGYVNTNGRIDGSMGGSWTLSDNWSEARKHPIVVAFERENRPPSEVEYANICGKPLMGGSVCQLPPGPHDGYCTNWNFDLGRSVVPDAASKLPAPLTEDAPWDKEEQQIIADAVAASSIPAASVGEREGEFEKSAFEAWISTTVGFTGDDVLFAHAGWNARAAIASKPSPEGIPKRPKVYRVGEITQPAWDYGLCYANEVEAIISAKEDQVAFVCKECEKSDAAKDAEIAAGRNKYAAYRDEMTEAIATAEDDLAHLNLSSARIEEEIM